MSVREINFTAQLEHDDLGTLVLPISSFTARIREGEPSYLQIVVPDYLTYADDILDWTTHCRNCQIVVHKIRDRDTANPTEVIRVDFENLRTDQGSKSQSVFMTGHRTFYNANPQTVALTDVDYVRTGIDISTGTEHRIRFSAYLNVTAGDTVTYTYGAQQFSFPVVLLTLNATEYDFDQEASSS